MRPSSSVEQIRAARIGVEIGVLDVGSGTASAEFSRAAFLISLSPEAGSE
jgi:hypothetical protein